jgi:hypothetical protein
MAIVGMRIDLVLPSYESLIWSSSALIILIGEVPVIES